MKMSAQCLLVSGLVAALSAQAQVAPDEMPGASVVTNSSAVVADESAKDFGTPRFWSSLDSFDMHPNSDGFVMRRAGSSGVFCGAATTDTRIVGQVQVPHGALLDLFRIWAFDSSAIENLTVTLRSTCLPDFGAAIPTPATLGTESTTGSAGAYSGSTALSNVTADNQSCTYQVSVDMGTSATACSTAMVFYKMRMQWYRQLPPQPASASFTDVPTTHQFFRAIEALRASGVTTGCTATQFCPDSTLTRAQMAAFLGRALGLALETIPDSANP